jgi:predicted Zn-dependent protease
VRWDQGEAKRTIERILSLAGPGDWALELTARTSSHTRFARNQISTSGFVEDVDLSVTSRLQGRSGSVGTNDLSTAGLKGAIARAAEMRDLMPVDPEAVEMLGPQSYPALEKHDDATASARAADRAAGVKATLGMAQRKSLTSAGFFENSVTHRAIGNSKGNFGYHLSTDADFSVTMRTGDGTGSGWAAGASPRLGDLDAKSLARRAADKGVASASPRDVPPGDYTVVLEPAAVADLLQTLRFGALQARTADEGRSVFSKQGGGSRVGEKVVHESVTLRTDPFDPRLPGAPWSVSGGFGGDTTDGLPNRRIAWIEKGILKRLHADRYWAGKTGVEATPFPGSLVLEGGAGSLEDLIAGTERGLLVTHFFYIRTVNPQTWQLTGLTRDGLFLIEKGKIAHPVTNLRFNESPIVMLQNIDAMSLSSPAGRMVVPAIRSKEFTFTSKSDAV